MVSTVNEARKIVEEYLATLRVPPEDSLVIVDDVTIEKPYGWVFHYTSRLHMEGNFRYARIGNGPIIIEKETGNRYHAATWGMRDEVLAEWEEAHYGKRFEEQRPAPLG